MQIPTLPDSRANNGFTHSVLAVTGCPFALWPSTSILSFYLIPFHLQWLSPWKFNPFCKAEYLLSHPYPLQSQADSQVQPHFAGPRWRVNIVAPQPILRLCVLNLSHDFLPILWLNQAIPLLLRWPKNLMILCHKSQMQVWACRKTDRPCQRASRTNCLYRDREALSSTSPLSHLQNLFISPRALRCDSHPNKSLSSPPRAASLVRTKNRQDVVSMTARILSQ